MAVLAAVAVVAALGGSQAQALEWDAAQYQRHGGLYAWGGAQACNDPSALRLQVTVDRLVVARGGQRFEARITDAAASYLGPSPPPGFQAALLTAPAGGRDLAVIASRDRAGRFLQLQADARTLATLGLPPDDTTAFRDCDSARRGRDGAAEARQRQQVARGARAAAATHPLADPAWAAAYRRALGGHLGTPWLARFDGPQPPPRTVQIAGRRYRLHAVCKPHDCADNHLVYAYDRGTDRGHALLVEGGGAPRLLGAPPRAVEAELRRQGQATWRQRP